MKYNAACISDLDGTLLGSNRKLSPANLSILTELGELGICRVLCTGRSLWSVRRVIYNDDPFDYVIFATGAGIMDWKTQQMVYACDLNRQQISKVYHALEACKIDYMLHHAVPDTHFMHYRPIRGSQDFWERIDYYKAFAQELTSANIGDFEAATQFMAIVDGKDEDVYLHLLKELHPLNTIRTTSPIDMQSLWIEIFAPEVSKGRTIKWFLQMLNLGLQDIMVIGNDYNDEDMLALGATAYVPENAPQELKEQYINVAHHDTDGFCEAVTHWLENR